MTRNVTEYRSGTAKPADRRRPAPDAAGHGGLRPDAWSYLTVMDQTTPVLLTSHEVADLLRGHTLVRQALERGPARGYLKTAECGALHQMLEVRR